VTSAMISPCRAEGVIPSNHSGPLWTIFDPGSSKAASHVELGRRRRAATRKGFDRGNEFRRIDRLGQVHFKPLFNALARSSERAYAVSAAAGMSRTAVTLDVRSC
jgi:hypothetical protein